MIAQTVFAAAIVASVSAGWESKTVCLTIGAGNLDEKKETSTGKNDALISTGDIASQVGVQCDQIPLLIGVAIEDECKNTPVSYFSGLKKYTDEYKRSVVKASMMNHSSVSAVMLSHSSEQP
ncbi:hypothetical protein E3Q09_04275 [Wallemia mellicola]|nr:hypothetical protein E3Q21_03367 [Wallemia mellicola]TIC30531.1 hypothetical protein E3Q09_04275 [Wallemia mellicola]